MVFVDFTFHKGRGWPAVDYSQVGKAMGVGSNLVVLFKYLGVGVESGEMVQLASA